MKILQVCPGSYEVGRGGISEHVRNISERLARNHDVTVFATNRNNMLPRYEFKNGVRVERFSRYAPKNAYFFSLEMALRMRQVEFDVVHGHGYHALPLHFSSLVKRRKLVVSTHFHGVGHSAFRKPLFRLFKPFGRRILEKADNVIAVSEFERSLLYQQFRFLSGKVEVVPNGVDLNEFANLKRHKSGIRSILYVGRLESYKGVQYLVEILPELADDVILKIVGRGSLRGFLENRAKKLKVGNRVFFYQGLSRKELLQKYVDADLFVLLSRYEAYSLAIAEALTAGIPCIVANTSALVEWVDNKICFGLDFPLQKRELADLISNVLDAGTSRQVVKKEIRTRILDWNDVVNLLDNIYTE